MGRPALLLSLLFVTASLSSCDPIPSRNPIYRRASTNKLGLPWTDTSVAVSQFRSKMTWYYNWGPNPGYPPRALEGLEFVPMFWGNKTIAQYDGLSRRVASGNVAAILGFNEPQQEGQSELTPAQAAELWMRYLQPLKQTNSSLRLGSPSPSSGPSAKPWMQEFFGNCTGCTVDFLALHWYYVDASSFINYITDMHDTFNLPVWVTEWACINFADPSRPCTGSAIPALMNATQSWMDRTSWIERYAWFGAFRSLPQDLNPEIQLFDKDGRITALGKQYIGWTNATDPPITGGDGYGKGALRLPTTDARLMAATLLTLACASIWVFFFH